MRQMKKMNRRRKRPGGFTLIELMVAVAIIGMVVVMGVLAQRANRDARMLKRASRDLLDLFQAARADAIRNGHAVLVVASGTGGVTNIAVISLANNSCTSDWSDGLGAVDVAQPPYQSARFTLLVGPSDASSGFCFLPSGRIMNSGGSAPLAALAGDTEYLFGGSAYIQISNASGSLRQTVAVDPQGRAELMPAGFDLTTAMTAPPSEG